MKSNQSASVRDGGESTDRLLQSFFASEMPRPWPAAPAVGASANRKPPVRPRSASLTGSRVALAASVLVLVGCCLALSSGDSATATRPSARPDILGGNAIVPKDLRPAGPVAPAMLPK